jgi:hypothetical protein
MPFFVSVVVMFTAVTLFTSAAARTADMLLRRPNEDGDGTVIWTVKAGLFAPNK